MNAISVVPLAGQGDERAEWAARLFVDSFYTSIKAISEDRALLEDFFYESIRRDLFSIAIAEDEPVGILACSSNQGRGIEIRLRSLASRFGIAKGLIAFPFLYQEFSKPLDLVDGQCYIESVAVAAPFRNRGFGTSMIRSLIDADFYDEFLLEVLDTNHAAIRLYESLGFSVYDTRRRSALEAGPRYGHRLYMRLDTSARRGSTKPGTS